MPEIPHLDPLPMIGLADYHVHCDYSVDAVGCIEQYCEAAIQRNLVEICFTTHYDSNPNSVDGDSGNVIRINDQLIKATPDALNAYVEHVHRAHEQYFPLGVAVKVGLEFGWYPGCEGTVAELRDRFHFDYMLCGVHELDNICYCCQHLYKMCFERYSLEQMAEKYFSEVITAARSGLFDTIAHLDYYKKFALDHYGDTVRSVHKPYLNDLFAALVETNTALEINTAAMRKGLNDYFPTAEIVNLARQAGVVVDRLGSDAHRPEQIGYDFEGASALAPAFISGCDD